MDTIADEMCITLRREGYAYSTENIFKGVSLVL